MAVGVALIVAALVLIASEPVDRTKVALAGAVLVLLTRSGSPSRPASTTWLVIQHWWHDTGEL